MKVVNNDEVGLKVFSRKGEPIDSLLKRFKRKLEKNGIIVKNLKKPFYEKPSDKKRRKRNENLRRLKREQTAGVNNFKRRMKNERKNSTSSER